MKIAIVLLAGLGISFFGQLPLSNMNMMATQLSVQEGFKKAWLFGTGIAIVEIIYLRIALSGMNWVLQHKILFSILGWLTVALFLVLGVLSFTAARRQAGEKKGLLLNIKLNRFLLGATVSAINPVQIPFWFIWSSYFVNNKVLEPNSFDYNLFTIGAGIGTLSGIAVYIHGGNWLITKMNTSNKTINKVMGVVFIVTALIQLYKLIYHPSFK